MSQKILFYCQRPYFGMERFHFCVKVELLLGFVLGKNISHLAKSLLFPLGNHIGVDVVTGRDLG